MRIFVVLILVSLFCYSCKKEDSPNNNQSKSCTTFNGSFAPTDAQTNWLYTDSLNFKNEILETGKGANWDFSNYSPQDSQIVKFLSPVGTPADSLYLSASLVAQIDTFQYLKMNSQGIFVLNTVSNYNQLPTSLPYESEILTHPFGLSTFKQTSKNYSINHKEELVTFKHEGTTLNADSIIFKRTGEISIVVNSCGTLKLPHTKLEAIGVQYTNEYTDSIFAYQFIGFGTQEILIYAKEHSQAYFRLYSDSAYTAFPVIEQNLSTGAVTYFK